MSSAGTNSASSGSPRGVIAYLRTDYVNTALFLSRLGTIFSCVSFLLAPFFSSSHPVDIDIWYRRALLAYAATSALRLHQRMKNLNTGLSRAVLEELVAEDSFHYLIYSIVFAFLAPVTVSLMPIFMFSLLHVTSFLQGLLDAGKPPGTETGSAESPYVLRLAQKCINNVKSNSETILRVVALNEIMLMLISIFVALTGPKIFLLPLLYYPFLKLRYNSRRNPYSKYAFYELRIAFQQLACHSKCPTFVAQLIYRLIGIVCRMGSPVYTRT